MDDFPSSAANPDDDTPSSPKRKKVRAKYAPKACVSCRRSKLKCSGENPCQRCHDNGRRCFYSEDQTAAEALQNLSRPAPIPHPSSTNGNDALRRNILPRRTSMERRASDASMLGMSMEARMSRVETMMEALVHERGARITPRGSAERESSTSDGMQTDNNTLPVLLEAFNPSAGPARQPLGFAPDAAFMDPFARPSLAAAAPTRSAENDTSIRVGTHVFPFPGPAEYEKYLDFYFLDINPHFPCVNEAEFRIRSGKMLASSAANGNDVAFLALHYAIFALTDLSSMTTPSALSSQPLGWRWIDMANNIVDKRQITGHGDMTLLQFLTNEVIYFIFADLPNSAYNTMGLVCRIGFQFGFHQESRWRDCTPFEVHMRRRIFWTICVLDRRLALSCGRPHGIRDSDHDVEQPSLIHDKDLHPNQLLPNQDNYRSANVCLNTMASWAKLAGEVWDHVFSASAARKGVSRENAADLDAQLKTLTETVLFSLSLVPTDMSSDTLCLRQHAFIYIRMHKLRLLLHRQALLSSGYDGDTGRVCGDMAVDIVQRVRKCGPDATRPTSARLDITAALGEAVLVLTALLTRNLASLGIQDRYQVYSETFRDAVSLLQDLSAYVQVAQRVKDDLKDVVNVTFSVVTHQLSFGSTWPVGLVPSNLDQLFPYRTLDFAEKAVAGSHDDEWPGMDSIVGPWTVETQTTTHRYGVLWI
ncbi:hypothetical protein EJ04DRAFT_513823 [Polyplosphaeria fusca]|uniref:Zn(2)-C6 fungal-type domain-containing protein n=1 Tax=Polyplosphaeria fusca TaxID=682080 RepID=A0A9P4QTT3_9PLEO|nr:hypothetical protein EJ04DRAFT_513823 [Polyplosphaeria fusca]